MRYIHLRSFCDATTGKPMTRVYFFEADDQEAYEAAIAAIDRAQSAEDDEGDNAR